MSFAQKLVHARMYAQGLTVVVLIASAGLGLTEKRLEQQEREDRSYKWAANSPHALAHKKQLEEEAAARE